MFQDTHYHPPEAPPPPKLPPPPENPLLPPPEEKPLPPRKPPALVHAPPPENRTNTKSAKTTPAITLAVTSPTTTPVKRLKRMLGAPRVFLCQSVASVITIHTPAMAMMA